MPKPKPWTPLRILKKVRKVLSDRRYWCTVYEARDRYGYRCDVRDPEARQWCLAGAVMRAGPERLEGVRMKAFNALHEELPLNDRHPGLKTFAVGAFNDCYGYASTMRLLDRAIARLERE